MGSDDGVPSCAGIDRFRAESARHGQSAFVEIDAQHAAALRTKKLDRHEADETECKPGGAPRP